MTTVLITAEITRTIPAENAYCVSVEIIDAVNIENAVLVTKTSDDTFSHVATVFDMETYPSVKSAAVSANAEYYRAASCQVTYDNVNEATNFESITRSRLKILAVSWSSVVSAFSGTDVVVITSSST